MARGKSCYLLSPMDKGCLCEPNGKVLGICVSPNISKRCLFEPHEKVRVSVGAQSLVRRVCVTPMRKCGYLCEPNG